MLPSLNELARQKEQSKLTQNQQPIPLDTNSNSDDKFSLSNMLNKTAHRLATNRVPSLAPITKLPSSPLPVNPNALSLSGSSFAAVAMKENLSKAHAERQSKIKVAKGPSTMETLFSNLPIHPVSSTAPNVDLPTESSPSSLKQALAAPLKSTFTAATKTQIQNHISLKDIVEQAKASMKNGTADTGNVDSSSLVINKDLELSSKDITNVAPITTPSDNKINDQTLKPTSSTSVTQSEHVVETFQPFSALGELNVNDPEYLDLQRAMLASIESYHEEFDLAYVLQQTQEEIEENDWTAIPDEDLEHRYTPIKFQRRFVHVITPATNCVLCEPMTMTNSILQRSTMLNDSVSDTRTLEQLPKTNTMSINMRPCNAHVLAYTKHLVQPKILVKGRLNLSRIQESNDKLILVQAVSADFKMSCGIAGPTVRLFEMRKTLDALPKPKVNSVVEVISGNVTHLLLIVKEKFNSAAIEHDVLISTLEQAAIYASTIDARCVLIPAIGTEADRNKYVKKGKRVPMNEGTLERYVINAFGHSNTPVVLALGERTLRKEAVLQGFDYPLDVDMAKRLYFDLLQYVDCNETCKGVTRHPKQSQGIEKREESIEQPVDELNKISLPFTPIAPTIALKDQTIPKTLNTSVVTTDLLQTSESSNQPSTTLNSVPEEQSTDQDKQTTTDEEEENLNCELGSVSQQSSINVLEIDQVPNASPSLSNDLSQSTNSTSISELISGQVPCKPMRDMEIQVEASSFGESVDLSNHQVLTSSEEKFKNDALSKIDELVHEAKTLREQNDKQSSELEESAKRLVQFESQLQRLKGECEQAIKAKVKFVEDICAIVALPSKSSDSEVIGKIVEIVTSKNDTERALTNVTSENLLLKSNQQANEVFTTELRVAVEMLKVKELESRAMIEDLREQLDAQTKLVPPAEGLPSNSDRELEDPFITQVFQMIDSEIALMKKSILGRSIIVKTAMTNYMFMLVGLMKMIKCAGDSFLSAPSSQIIRTLDQLIWIRTAAHINCDSAEEFEYQVTSLLHPALSP